MSTMLPTLAAHAATNPLQTLEQAGKKMLTNAEKQAKGLLSSVTTAGDPTAAQVTQGLLGVYAHQQVWPWGLQSGAWGKYALIPGQWYAGYTPEPTSDWYGLSLVFPNKPASEWPKLLSMTNAPADKPITAGTLAQWLYNWEKLARIPHAQWNMLKYQPSQNAYTLMSDYNMFWGTNFTSPQTLVSAHDLTMVERNIVSVDQCYRVLAPNKIQVLVPMTEDISTPAQEAKNLATMDSVIVTFPGHNLVNVTVGNTAVPIQLDGTETLVNAGLWYQQNPQVIAHQTYTLDAFFPKGKAQRITNVNNQLTEFKTDPQFVQAPNWYNPNAPFFVFGLSPLKGAGIGFFPPVYDFGFANGKLSHFAVEGTKYNSWPYFAYGHFSE
jgi:hypothetical protein